MAKGCIVIGIKEIDRALKSFEPRVAKKLVKAAMRKAMRPVKAAVEQNAPVDTGLLRSAVKIRASKKSRTSFGIDVRIGEQDWVGQTWYAAAQEYGTSRMEGTGFMRKAFDETGEEAKAIALRELLAGIEQETKRSG